MLNITITCFKPILLMVCKMRIIIADQQNKTNKQYIHTKQIHHTYQGLLLQLRRTVYSREPVLCTRSVIGRLRL